MFELGDKTAADIRADVAELCRGVSDPIRYSGELGTDPKPLLDQVANVLVENLPPVDRQGQRIPRDVVFRRSQTAAQKHNLRIGSSQTNG